MEIVLQELNSNESYWHWRKLLYNDDARHGIVLPFEVFKYVASKSNGKLLERRLPEGLTTEMFGMAFERNHMLFDTFDKKFKQLFTHGLINHFLKKHDESARPETYANSTESAGPKVLTMEHLKGGFIVFLVPLAASAVVFALEWLMRYGEYLIIRHIMSAYFMIQESFLSLYLNDDLPMGVDLAHNQNLEENEVTSDCSASQEESSSEEEDETIDFIAIP